MTQKVHKFLYFVVLRCRNSEYVL